MFAAAGIYEIDNEIHNEVHYMTGTGTGRGNPPPGPLHDILEDLKATGRGGPGPRPLHPAQLFSVYGKLAVQRAGHINDQAAGSYAAGSG